MRTLLIALATGALLQGCNTGRRTTVTGTTAGAEGYTVTDDYNPGQYADTTILTSHFEDKNATISEEAIQKILNGTLKLPARLRVAVVKLENPNKSYRSWNDEDYIKLQQLYVDRFTAQLKKSGRVSTVSVVPGLLAGFSPSMNQIREVAVRMQADVAVVFTTQNDIYAKYRLFSKTSFKAFATTQLLVMDIRTGLVPFTEIATRDFLTQKTAADTENDETRNRALREAVTLTIDDLSGKLMTWLEKEAR